MRSGFKGWRVVGALALGSVVVPVAASASATLIPMDHHVSDVAYDSARHLIYMADDTQVLRYDVEQGTFLAPFTVIGGPLGSMDLAPDGHTLAVGDTSQIAVKVHLIDLDTGKDNVESVAAFSLPENTYQVAYTRDGNLVVSTVLNGSGNVWLRALDVSTGVFSLIDYVAEGTPLSTSGDGLVVGLAEFNDVAGAYGYYQPKSGKLARFPSQTAGRTDWNWGVATNADGTRLIVSGVDGTFVYGGDNVRQMVISDGSVRASVADPVSALAYFAYERSSQVHAFDLDTHALTATYDFGEAFSAVSYIGPYTQAPQLRISRDGSMLLARFDDGVRYLQVRAPLQADDVSASTAGSRVQIPLQGHVGNGERLSYGVQVPPAHGRVFVEGATATYVPAPGYSGQDSFVYAAHYGMAVAEGTVTVDVTADTSAYAPQVSFDTLPVLQATTAIPGSTRVPGDFNGDGNSDLVWFNDTTSQVGYWTMAPASTTTNVRRTGARTFGITAGYLIGAVGDFNGDGYADLMFTSPAHDLWLWTNSRTGSWQSARSYDYPAAWQLVGAGDVNGDGKDDLLWLDPSDCKFAYWLMDGSVRKGSRVMDVGCGYYPVGVGYYTPTNRLSILWSSAANDLYVWDARDPGFRSYDLTGALQANAFALGMDGIWALGGGQAGKGLGIEWNSQDQRFAVGAKLDRTFDASGNQTGYRTTLQWAGGLWVDNPSAAGYLIHGGSAPSTALYALDANAMNIQIGGLPEADAASTGTAPRIFGTEFAFPAGWQPVGAPGNRGIPLPWK